MKKRASGILFHITSLPSPYGIGDLGTWAYTFADFLAKTKQSFWQILPLNLTDLVHGNSPYNSISAFANNTLLISPEIMYQNGFLRKNDIEPLPSFPDHYVSYREVTPYKRQLFHRAYEYFKGNNRHIYEYEKFCLENSNWLDDFALFTVIKNHFHGQVWSKWPEEIRDRKPESIQTFKTQYHSAIEKKKFLQYLFFQQWSALKNYCNDRGIQIIGDMPIYVCYDSADVWANPDLFKLNEEKQPSFVAGVPPDYFSVTGQLWGNPVYHWDRLKETEYTWWIQRMKQNLRLFDMVRIDHFRGFVAYWEVPSTEKTAVNGRWVEAPAEHLFTTFLKHFPYLPIIAEDLGTITPDVRETIRHFEFPGMRVLLFAFGWNLPTNPYAPHNHIRNCLVYTGTHDNNTIQGWLEKEAAEEDKERLSRYLGKEISSQNIHWELIRLAMMSVANLSVFPMQDILGLGEESRMNFPSKKDGNWLWRLLPANLTQDVIQKLLEMTETYGRA
ncbi:MAG: 4-alpha-glucanotransferase [wastewater metagenome]|nr:4-alpha-glucanotransferase [Candidatus Loosdrechtia aerotolerans]